MLVLSLVSTPIAVPTDNPAIRSYQQALGAEWVSDSVADAAVVVEQDLRQLASGGADLAKMLDKLEQNLDRFTKKVEEGLNRIQLSEQTAMEKCKTVSDRKEISDKVCNMVSDLSALSDQNVSSLLNETSSQIDQIKVYINQTRAELKQNK